MRVSMSFILCDGKHMRASMIFLILDWKHMRVFYFWGCYVRKHMRFRIHALHRFGKLLFLRSRVFWRCHDVAEKLSR